MEKVLLVDDEKEFLDTMAERMEARDMDVTTTTSPKEALLKAQEESFDAIILDLMMPEMDGLETLKELKKKNPDLQVILLTGHATVQKGVEAMKLGATDLLEKTRGSESPDGKNQKGPHPEDGSGAEKSGRKGETHPGRKGLVAA